ncbi:MAG: protease inhibitor I9 family protein [Pyrinomonadaceae bacterium]
MAGRIDDELQQEVSRLESTEPEREIPVIVNLNDWSKRGEVKEKGLKVEHEFENISALSGTLTPAEVKDVSQLGQVESIEFDGEVRAISGGG